MKSASYSTNGFVTGSTIMWVVIISQAAFFIMIPLFFLGLHVFLITGIFLASIYLGFMLVTGKVLYTVDADGLTKDATPNMMKNFWKKRAFQFYSWDQIKNFKSGTDASRSLEEFDFLTVNTMNGNKLEINTKKGDRNSFKLFEEAFRYYVEEVSAGNIADATRPVTAKLEKEEALTTDKKGKVKTSNIQHEIKEKPTFYKTFFAKVVTIFFILLMIVLTIAMVAMNNSRPGNLFRLLLVIAPGVIYMTYRVFVKED